MNFSRINEHLLVGSHPQTAADIDELYNHHGVRAIVNLQRSEEQHRGDIDAITVECARLGIWYQHVPVGFLDNSLQHFRITQMNHVKNFYYLKEIIFQSNELLIINSINT
jgi:protein tyrosine phosphatase (PTP) superfamily phosphohydrolase (DUF442 family)